LDNGERLARALSLTLANLYGWPGMKPAEHSVAEVSIETLDHLVGTYAVPSPADEGTGKTSDFEITREVSTLVVTDEGERDMTPLPESDWKFFRSRLWRTR